jgi:hypothetical protein
LTSKEDNPSPGYLNRWSWSPQIRHQKTGVKQTRDSRDQVITSDTQMIEAASLGGQLPRAIA